AARVAPASRLTAAGVAAAAALSRSPTCRLSARGVQRLRHSLVPTRFWWLPAGAEEPGHSLAALTARVAAPAPAQIFLAARVTSLATGVKAVLTAAGAVAGTPTMPSAASPPAVAAA